MNTIFALIVVTCTYGDDFCQKLTTYYATEEECGVAAKTVAKVAAENKPSGVIVYRCESTVDQPPLVPPPTADHVRT